MELIYTLTVLAMLVLHMLIYKKEEKENVLKWFAISIIALLCYNILICLMMYFIKISATLISLSVVNIIINIGLVIKICKDKKIQKYNIDKIDILQIVLIILVAILVLVNQYGIPLNIKNKTTDSSVHYFAADDFYNYSALLLEENSDILNLWDLQFLMPGAYVNTGILFKIFSGMISETYFYQIYYIFDICIWALSGILMYCLLSKKKENKILAVIFSLIYMLGYPLNSLLSGFSYLGIGLNLIIVILMIIKEELNKYYKYLLMFLVNLGLFFSYYFFVPVVYLAIFVQIMLDIKKENKKLLTVENFLHVLYTLIIPSILGILYFIVFQIIDFGGKKLYVDVINIPGYIYTNFITNVLIFLGLAIYYIKSCKENRQDNFGNKMFIINIFFMILLFIGMKLKVVSKYYYYKTYYLLWLLVISVGFNGIKLIIDKGRKEKIISYICICIYIIGMIYATKTNQNLLIFDIFKDNSYEIQLKNKVLITQEEIKVLEYYNKNINTPQDGIEDNTYMCMPPEYNGRYRWLYVLTRNPYNYLSLTFAEELTADVKQFIESDKQYFLLFKKDFKGDYDKVDQSIEENNLKVLFRNDVGMILEKQGGTWE